MGDSEGCLHLLRELDALARAQDPDCPYGGFPPEVLKAGDGAIEEALARGYIRKEETSGRVYLHGIAVHCGVRACLARLDAGKAYAFYFPWPPPGLL